MENDAKILKEGKSKPTLRTRSGSDGVHMAHDELEVKRQLFVQNEETR